MGLKDLFLEAKWQLYRPVIRIQYGWAYLVVDLYLDMRDRKEERQELTESWNLIKTGLWTDDANVVGMGQSRFKGVVYSIMWEAIK